MRPRTEFVAVAGPLTLRGNRQFISLFCETCFYGMYTVLFMTLLVNYRERPATSRSVQIIRAITIFQYCMVTVHISLAFYQNYLAFTVFDDAETEFNKLGAASYTLAQLAIEWTNCACADSILIWRVWILWNHSLYVVIVPIILVIVSTTSGYLVCWSMNAVDSSASSDFGDLFGPAVEKWAILLAICVMLTNIICTGMIAGRIWWHNRETQKAMGLNGMPHKYRTIFYGILESGALYLLAWIVAILLYLINTSAIIPMLDIISQLSGIVPALIVIIVSRSIDAATHYEEALTTINYRRNSRMQMGTSCTVDRELRASPKNSLEMIPMMDVDEQEAVQLQPSQPPPPPQQARNSRISSAVVFVDDNHPFDLDSYISNYTGRAAIDRLTHIVSVCPSVAVDAFTLAVRLIQKARDPGLFQTLCHAYEQVSAYSDVKLPSISELPAIQTKWTDDTLKKNQSEKMKLEAELKNYSNNMIKESIRMGHRDLAEFSRSVGDYPSALKHWTKSREFCTTSQHVLDGCLSTIELLIEQRNYSHLPTYVFKAEAALEAVTSSAATLAKAENSSGAGGSRKTASAMSPDREILQSKLDFATALGQLAQSNYERAAYHFLRLSSGTGSGGGLARIAWRYCHLWFCLRARVVIEEPHVREMIEAYMASNFKGVLETLGKYNTRHTIDIHLFPHLTTLNSLTRNRLVSLYFAPFSSIKLDRMAQAFGWSVVETEDYVVGLVRSGDIGGRVDSRAKVLQVKKTDHRAELFAHAIKTGVEIAKTNKKLLYRIKLQQADGTTLHPLTGFACFV
ncbi:cop9 signalosome complex subunit 1 [Lentinula edodes]|uniref:Cop9 signalosome complex subunit 1 n=1 Tax=Lentinula edodes TaxID=5353 RepID=A0A1Q3DX57_LENED|nr:cop9 signalosome complex subunit 1 [Lentinula edodes]